jgi:hypothetical protein
MERVSQFREILVYICYLFTELSLNGIYILRPLATF